MEFIFLFTGFVISFWSASFFLISAHLLVGALLYPPPPDHCVRSSFQNSPLLTLLLFLLLNIVMFGSEIGFKAACSCGSGSEIALSRFDFGEKTISGLFCFRAGVSFSVSILRKDMMMKKLLTNKRPKNISAILRRPRFITEKVEKRIRAYFLLYFAWAKSINK